MGSEITFAWFLFYALFGTYKIIYLLLETFTFIFFPHQNLPDETRGENEFIMRLLVLVSALLKKKKKKKFSTKNLIEILSDLL